jgi:hypothetical protein
MKTLLAVLACVGLLWSQTAHASESPGEVFREAASKFENKKYREAAQLFEKAFALAPTAQAAYNAGIAWDEADARARAASMLTRAVNLGELSSIELREASRRLGLLVPTLGKLVFEGPKGVEIRVGEQSATAPGVLYVDPGQHDVEATLANGEARRESVNVGAGESRAFAFDSKAPLAPTPAPRPRPREPRPAPASSTAKTVGWVSLGLAAASVGAGVYLNVRGSNENRDFEDGGRRDASQRERAVNLRTLAFVAYGAGAVLGGVGTVLLLTSGDEETGVAYRARF